VIQAATNPILVTGAHRTGTTWVGKSLAADPRLAYISEPLNVHHRPGVFGARIASWYTYICRDNEAEYLPRFHELLSFRYHASAEIASLRSGRDALRMARDVAIFVAGNVLRKRALLKDPFAVFSLAWFAERLNCEIVVMVRHPAAFASSLKRLEWTFDFNDLLVQPLLMRDYLESYRAAMRSVAAGDVIGQAALLWAMIYRSVDAMRQQIPSVRVIRHEDLSLDPGGGFERLFRHLGLSFTDRTRRVIAASSSSENPPELAPGMTHSVKLDSRASLDRWKHRLSVEEISRVRRATDEVAHLYYPEVAWT
jgi:hypothetical protein